MKVNRINNYNTFKSNDTNKTNYTNVPKLSGQLTLGFLGTTVLTGILHKPKLHVVSTILTAASALIHVLSLNPKTKNISHEVK